VIEIGQSVGNYVVSAKLGEGGMGIVYLAEHPVIGRKVALKAIHPQYAKNPEVISRFVTEAKAVNQIGHEHIVDVTDFGTTAEGDFYFAMEYLQGAALVDLIQNGPPFAVFRALRIGAQIADALQASHDHGVIHRDLKPDNIFLVPHGDDPDFVKILDFGLAKLVDPTGATPTHSTQVGLILGTPYYMAPEQCEGKAEIDHRADVYALGVILFEMLTGKLPFGGDSYGEIMVKQINMAPPAARSIVPELPPVLDAILFRALAKNPAQRFQSMSALRAALLDLDGYAASLPETRLEDDLSGRVRAAWPMARSDINLRPTPVTARADASTRRPRESTPYEGVGEIGEAGELNASVPPRSHNGRWAMLGVAALSTFVVLSTSAYRSPVASVVAVAHALSRPATVRLNFNSDPAGATVVRADGQVLGVTPLSTMVPFADVPQQYLVRKAGFRAKSVSLVPNLPSPVFAVLQADEPPQPPVLAAPAPPSDPIAAEHRPTARVHVSHSHPKITVPTSFDEDEALPPSIQE
jgi:serine/threonine protein kinase